MNTELPTNEAITNKKKKKGNGGTGLLIIMLIVFVMFLATSTLLGSRLYDMATRDQYTVNMTVGETGEIELFDIQYSNETGDITVQGVSEENIVAPGTSVNYDIRLRNDDDIVIDFVMLPHVKFHTENDIPIRFKLKDDHGNYLLGDEDTWAYSDSMNAMEHKGQIHPGEVFTYHLTWQWIFEESADQDAYDTFLANMDGDIVPGVTMGISTETMASVAVSKDVTHITHLQGKSAGCCWCCWLVWVFMLITVLLLLWIWQLKKKLSRMTRMVEDYEQNLMPKGTGMNT